MRRLFLVVLLLTLAGTTQAIDIKGKWGLGVGLALTGSKSEGSLIRGKTERSAWILDMQLYHRYLDDRADSSGRITSRESHTYGHIGPRIRRYTRPQAKLSPYWDVYFHLKGEGESYTTWGRAYAGAEGGIDAGAEYFTPWHFSLGAHTGIFNVGIERSWAGSHGIITSRGWRENSNLSFYPSFQARVYF